MEIDDVEVRGAASRPLAASRRAEVLAAVAARGTIRVTELAAELGVTPVTVRRDVADLAGAGLVRRVHGGAVAVAPELRRAASAAESPSARTEGDDGVAHPTQSGAAVGVPGTATRTATVGERPAAVVHAALGMLVPSLDFYWPDVARGAEEEASALGMRLLLRGSVYDAPDERGDVERLVEGGADALLLAPTLRGAGGELMLEWLTRSPVPVVLMERTAVVGQEHRPVESVVTDHAAGAAMAVHHLASLGHVRVGAALADGSPHVGQIHAGWLQARVDLGLTRLDALDLPLPDQRAAGFDAILDELLEQVRSTGTTALLVHSDPQAIRLVQRAQEVGLRVPEDLSVVSYDDQVATLATPQLTAVRPPRRTIGRTAVGLLAARLADPGRPVHRVTVSPTLFVRDSTARPV